MRRMWIITGAAAAVLAVTNVAAGASARANPAGRGGPAGPQGDSSQISAFDINAGGEIVGSYFHGAVSHGFVLRNGVFTTLNAPGSAHFTEAKGGYVLSHGRYQTFNDPNAARGTHPHAINVGGDIVGGYIDRSGRIHGFLLHDGRYTTINVP